MYRLTLENVSEVFERAGLCGKLDMPCGLWLENEEKRKMPKNTGRPYLYRKMTDIRSRLDFPSVLLHHPNRPQRVRIRQWRGVPTRSWPTDAKSEEIMVLSSRSDEDVCFYQDLSLCSAFSNVQKDIESAGKTRHLGLQSPSYS